jgi:hypothetical protein
MTGVGRAVEPVEGEIAVTVGAGALGAVGGGGVGAEGDCPSQAANPNASANSNTPRWVISGMVGMVCTLLFKEAEKSRGNLKGD